MHFHTKLNGFQQLAYWLVMISEILSNTMHLEMGFRNEKLQYKLIMASLSPIISTLHTTDLVL